MVKVKEDLTGKKFGKLTVLHQIEDYIKPSGKKVAQWLCECDCQEHNKVIVRGIYLKSGHTQSCGCLRVESQLDTHKKYNDYDLSGEFGVGWTSNTNKEFYFDLEDYDKIKDYCWYEKDDGAIVCKSKDIIYMHRLVMNAPNNLQIDHIYHNRNDNRKSKLRIAHNTQNTVNRGMQSNNTSGIIGVSWNKQLKKWHAYISIYNKRINLGYFDNIDNAIIARKQAEDKYFGEWKYKENEFN